MMASLRGRVSDIACFLSAPRFLRITKIVAAFGAAVIFAILSVSMWTSWRAEPRTNIIAEWSDSIGQLGIEAIYPPQEDVVVGDIYFAITKDNEGHEALVSNLISRSIKIDHIDLSNEVDAYLRSLYTFPATTVRPADPKAPWVQAPLDDKTFAPDRVRTAKLPLVLFPGVTIARTRTASASFAGTLRGLAASLDLVHEERKAVDLKIPFAETYGTTNLAATKRLVKYCHDPQTKTVCSESAIRHQLSMIVGDQIFEKTSDKKKYRYDCEIILIDRVYLIRAIDATTENEAMTSGQAGQGQHVDVGEKAYDDQKIVASQSFVRPITIGFRAVRSVPFY